MGGCRTTRSTRHLRSIKHERGEGVGTHPIGTVTHQALLVLLSQQAIAQALAVVTLSLHLLSLHRQLLRQAAAIIRPILRGASISVPAPSRTTSKDLWLETTLPGRISTSAPKTRADLAFLAADRRFEAGHVR